MADVRAFHHIRPDPTAREILAVLVWYESGCFADPLSVSRQNVVRILGKPGNSPLSMAARVLEYLAAIKA